MTICDRCLKVSIASTCSYFNTEQICLDCAETERNHPDYERARRTELGDNSRANMCAIHGDG